MRYTVKQYLEHYHNERNHQGLDNVIPFLGPEVTQIVAKSIAMSVLVVCGNIIIGKLLKKQLDHRTISIQLFRRTFVENAF